MAKKDVAILIVDDEESVRKFLATCLGLDYGCVTAHSAEEAIALMGNRCFNLIVVDLILPGISGIQLCRQVRQTSPESVLIAMSGASDIRSRVEAMKQGALYFIEKPFNTGCVQKLVEAALSSQAAAAAKRKSGWSDGDTFAVKTGTGALAQLSR